MKATWIVLADEGRARILAAPERGTDLTELEEMTDAAAHADNADFRHDAYGRRAGADARMGGNATASAGEEKLDHEADLFARRVAQRLAQAHQQGRFERLRIAAAPRFLGRLRKVLEPEVARTVVEEIDKNLLQFDRRELTRRLCPDEPGT
jgi:protein required for attachment to host cells